MNDDIKIELTILMPCLNEEETLAICIEKAQNYLERSAIAGEVLIADNGSTDSSIAIAESKGARVVHVPIKGYGSAILHGIKSARGRYVIMGDADDSYDFSHLDNYVNHLRDNIDLVMGNRFKGGISPKAMPPLHKYLGNPVLSFIGRLFFNIPVGDFHCGLRGFNREKILSLNLKTRGMEFASEMVVKAALSGLSISEVPTTLSPDGRSRPPHLNTWRDGWRHLRFLLIYSPRWLFYYPSLVILVFGVLLTSVLLFGDFALTSTITLGVHSLIAGCFSILIGLQGISFAIISRRYASSQGLLPAITHHKAFIDSLTLEKVLSFCVVLLLIGLYGFFNSLHAWYTADLGPLEYGSLTRTMVLSGTSIAASIQVSFSFFLAEIISIKSDNPDQNSK